MRRTVRLTERDLTRLVRRVIREQEEDVSALPTCNSKMVNDGNPGSSSEMTGSFTKITFNGTVSRSRFQNQPIDHISHLQTNDHIVSEL